jgi:endonuclease III
MPPAITNKQQLLTFAQNALKKKFPLAVSEPPAEPRPLLEELVYAICREGSTPADADASYARLRKAFIDWNEVRVSTVQEVGEILRPLSAPGSRAKRIIGLLQEVFEATYTFDLGELTKKGLKDTARKLRFYKEGVNDYAVAWVVQRTLGGHAIPLDEPTLRVLTRLGVVEDVDPESLEAVRGSIEHIIPKTRGPEFTDLMSVHAKELCIEKDPRCPACPLKTECPVGIENTSKKTEPKPKKSR